MKHLTLPLINIEDCYTYTDVLKKLKLPNNGKYNRIVRLYIEYNNINIDHFDKHKNKRKYSLIKKECPICNIKFTTKERKF